MEIMARCKITNKFKRDSENERKETGRTKGVLTYTQSDKTKKGDKTIVGMHDYLQPFKDLNVFFLGTQYWSADGNEHGFQRSEMRRIPGF